MSRVVQDFTDLLLKQGVISLDQLNEAESVAKTTNADVGDVLIQMEYATPEEVAQALAKHHKIPYVDLRSASISDSVIELRGTVKRTLHRTRSLKCIQGTTYVIILYARATGTQHVKITSAVG